MPMLHTQNDAEAGAATDGGRRPTVVASPASASAEISARPRRRTFTVADKVRILAATDRALERPLLRGTLTFTRRDGRERKVPAMASGKAITLVGRRFQDGPTHLYGAFREGAFWAIQEAMGPQPGFEEPKPRQLPKYADIELPHPNESTSNTAAEASTNAVIDADIAKLTHAQTEPKIVSGHHKRQRCGPGGKDRKVIWIRAYEWQVPPSGQRNAKPARDQAELAVGA